MGNPARPFYDEYAWAYDLIITQPVSQQCDFIEDILSRRGIASGAWILDAGCGVGSHAIELARRGYVVNAVDLSPQFIAEAHSRVGDKALPVSFHVGNILELSAASPYDAILCRGVLNDLLDKMSRRRVFFSFAGVLRSQGVLILDVREWDATVSRKSEEPVFEKVVETPLGRLTFRSVTRLEHQTRRLLVSEQHTLRHQNAETVSTYDFSMRCWTKGELQEYLTQAGFEAIEYFGAYDRSVPVGTNDRLVSVASKV
jgi:2-polyprenyl-3-methyl-5-hydroxy-6-metoxy-1,4-benzoquinol methylase